MKRKQIIDFEDCDKCGVGILYQMNDADDGFFYDCDPVYCEDCGLVGSMVCDEESCYVSFNWEIYLEKK